MYNFKRALGIGFALYVATFVFGIIAGVVSGVDMSSMANVPDSFWYIGMVSSVVLTALFTFWYFKTPTVTPSWQSGVLFGVTVLALSFTSDIALLTLGNMQGANVDLWDYYGDFRFWIIVILVIGTAKSVGWYKGRSIQK